MSPKIVLLHEMYLRFQAMGMHETAEKIRLLILELKK